MFVLFIFPQSPHWLTQDFFLECFTGMSLMGIHNFYHLPDFHLALTEKAGLCLSSFSAAMRVSKPLCFMKSKGVLYFGFMTVKAQRVIRMVLTRLSWSFSQGRKQKSSHGSRGTKRKPWSQTKSLSNLLQQYGIFSSGNQNWVMARAAAYSQQLCLQDWPPSAGPHLWHGLIED